MGLHGKNIVGGELSAEGSTTFRAVDPAKGAPIEPPFHEATQAEVDKALGLADEAFAKRPRDPAGTVGLLERIADGIEGLGEELIQRCG